jgi:uncharacterized protein
MKGGEKMKGLNICIDIDGTVTEPYYWLEEANRYFSRNLKPEDVKFYEIDKVYGVNKQDYECFYNEFGEDLHSGSEMLCGTNEVIGRLSNEHRIHFVTAREEVMRDVSAGWLKRHGIPFDTLSMLGTCHKVERAIELQCNLFVEDSLDNALELSDAGFNVLLVDCNYNKGLLPPRITRVKDWRQIEKLINEHPRKEELQMAM